MSGFFSSSAMKWVAIAGIISVVAAGIYRISSLRGRVAVAEQNTITLVEQIQDQNKVIEKAKTESREINSLNERLSKAVIKQQREIKILNDKFTVTAKGESRDFGAIAAAKPKLIQKIVNRGTRDVNRCFELVSGQELNEGETNDSCKTFISTLSD